MNNHMAVDNSNQAIMQQDKRRAVMQLHRIGLMIGLALTLRVPLFAQDARPLNQSAGAASPIHIETTNIIVSVDPAGWNVVCLINNNDDAGNLCSIVSGSLPKAGTR